MVRAFVGIGSNIRPEENVRKALQLLASQVNLVGISTVYSTEAEGQPELPRYYNCVAEIETEISPTQLKHEVLRKIEEKLGRERTEDKYAPRTIDLDLILYGDLVLKSDDLVLPDPQIQGRPYLAIPLYELDSELILPGIDIRMEEVAGQLEHSSMIPLRFYTAFLKKEILHG